MRATLLTLIACLMAAPAARAEGDVARLMEQYLWQKRVMLVFSPTAEDADYTAQRDTLAAHAASLAERDFVVWEVVDGRFVRLDGAVKPQLATQPFYRTYDVKTAEFTVLLLGKDGEEKLRRTSPIAAADWEALVDAMPMRQREMRE